MVDQNTEVIEWFKNRIVVMPESETKEMFRMAISALEKQEQVNTQNINSTHTSRPNALESLNILEQAKDNKGCVPMSLVRQAFRNVLEQDRWIPVTERLPKVHESGNSFSGIFMQSNPVLVYGVAEYEEEAQFHVVTYCDDLDGHTYWSTELDALSIKGVKAWRPLPEPYTEEET